MLRSIVLILVISFSAFSNDAHPTLSSSDTPPTDRDFPDKPDKLDPPSLTDVSYSPAESSDPSASALPRQDIPERGLLELQTGDSCDSADMVRFVIPLPKEGNK